MIIYYHGFENDTSVIHLFIVFAFSSLVLFNYLFIYSRKCSIYFSFARRKYPSTFTQSQCFQNSDDVELLQHGVQLTSG